MFEPLLSHEAFMMGTSQR